MNPKVYKYLICEKMTFQISGESMFSHKQFGQMANALKLNKVRLLFLVLDGWKIQTKNETIKTLETYFREYLCNLGGEGKVNKHETKD